MKQKFRMYKAVQTLLKLRGIKISIQRLRKLPPKKIIRFIRRAFPRHVVSRHLPPKAVKVIYGKKPPRIPVPYTPIAVQSLLSSKGIRFSLRKLKKIPPFFGVQVDPSVVPVFWNAILEKLPADYRIPDAAFTSVLKKENPKPHGANGTEEKDAD